MFIKWVEQQYKRRCLDGLIWLHYRTLNPDRVQLVESDCTLFVDPRDFRARKHLIAGSVRGRFPRNQRFWREAVRQFQPDVAIDVGLNYGECLLAATYDESVRLFGFEANPALRSSLHATVNDHPNRQQIEVLFQLVSDGEPGESDFFVDRKWSGRSTAGLQATDDDPKRYEKIRVAKASIDHVLDIRKLSSERLLFKIDVEGFEQRVLSGMRETLCRTPHAVGFVEFNGNFLRRAGTDLDAYWQFLQESFAVYAFDSADRWRRVNGWTLARLTDLCGRHFHTDLVLAAPGDASLAESILSVWERDEPSGLKAA